MIASNIEFMAKTVAQSEGRKSAILTNEAPTIIEKFKGKKIVSIKHKKKTNEIKAGGKEGQRKVVEITETRISAERPSVTEKFSKNIITPVSKEEYKKGEVNRFAEYVSPKAPASAAVSIKPEKDMSKQSLIADIIEEKVMIPNKPLLPMISSDEMSDFGDGEMLPSLWLNLRQLPSAAGLTIGDRICLEVEAEVTNYNFNEDNNGNTRHEYTFKLRKGVVKNEQEEKGMLEDD